MAQSLAWARSLRAGSSTSPAACSAAWAALAAQGSIITIFLLRNAVPVLKFSYLWYNLIGCALCVVLSLALQAVLGRGKEALA